MMNLRMKPIMGLLACLCLLPALTVCGQDDEKSPRELFGEAAEATANQEFAKAADILAELDKRIPDNPQIQFNLGYNLHAAGKLDEAIVYHKKAVASDDFKPTALYNLACAYSIKEESDKAFDYLKQSIEAGFRAMDTITTDPDMTNIKEDPRFKEMLTLIENDGKAPEKKLSAKDLYGSWNVESGSRSGAKIDDDRLPTITITKESFTIPAGPGNAFVMSYKLDLDAKPMTVDFKIESGPAEGTAKGIIKYNDGKMMLCYEPTGGDRPAKFLSTEENGYFVFKMKKAEKMMDKKASIAKSMLGKWKCVKGSRAGDDVPAARMESVISIDEKLITIPVGPDQAFKMSYMLDDSKSPIAIDMKIEEGPAPDGAAVGIVKMEDGKFYLCYDPTGANRPSKFESSEENGYFMFVMESAKE